MVLSDSLGFCGFRTELSLIALGWGYGGDNYLDLALVSDKDLGGNCNHEIIV